MRKPRFIEDKGFAKDHPDRARIGAPAYWLLQAAFSVSATVMSTVVAIHTLLLLLGDIAKSF